MESRSVNARTIPIRAEMYTSVPLISGLCYASLGTAGWTRPVLTSLLTQANSQFAQRAFGHIRRRLAHEIRPLSRFREWNHVADGSLAGENHYQTIQTQRDAAVGRGAVLEGVEQEAEFVAGFLLGRAGRGEKLRPGGACGGPGGGGSPVAA